MQRVTRALACLLVGLLLLGFTPRALAGDRDPFAAAGGGYGVLQLLIEDVTGEPFADYMRQAVKQPLGMAGYDWAWTPELRAAAATPYGFHGDPLPCYRGTVQAIGSRYDAPSAPAPNSCSSPISSIYCQPLISGGSSPSCVMIAEICVRCSVEWLTAWTIRLASLYSIRCRGGRCRTLVSFRAESANWSSSSPAQRTASFSTANGGNWSGESGWGGSWPLTRST